MKKQYTERRKNDQEEGRVKDQIKEVEFLKLKIEKLEKELSEAHRELEEWEGSHFKVCKKINGYESRIKVLEKELSEARGEVCRSCHNCKHIKKEFDGVCGETWSCKELAKHIGVLNVGMTSEEHKKLVFHITGTDIRCDEWDRKKS